MTTEFQWMDESHERGVQINVLRMALLEILEHPDKAEAIATRALDGVPTPWTTGDRKIGGMHER